jgi:gas vesicle protein
VGDALPDANQVKRQAQQAVSVAQENPIGLLVGSAAVGFLAGMLLPRTRMEDEKIGELSDQVKQTASQAGQEALQHGKEVAQTASQAAIETVKDEGASHGEELSSSVQQRAKETAAESVRKA